MAIRLRIQIDKTRFGPIALRFPLAKKETFIKYE